MITGLIYLGISAAISALMTYAIQDALSDGEMFLFFVVAVLAWPILLPILIFIAICAAVRLYNEDPLKEMENEKNRHN